MRTVLAFCLILLILTLTEAAAAQNKPLQNSAAVASMDRKLQRVGANGVAAHPDQTPTEFTEEEVNSYIASGRIQLPAGVQSVKFQGEPGIITANTRVDFDQI
ncbi:MAG TPA: hypothetical protein VFO27_09830, partial [Bryobacteraceae bacterium]|nr:hypothetical protein [Bryobacteraceae bacterium]